MRRLRRFKKVPHWILILHEIILACFLEVQISELLQIVDERGCTAPFVYNLQ
jgi:hypothetical protein